MEVFVLKNKGFIHVVESVIVILLLLIVVSQFFFFPAKDTGWEDFSLLRMGRDILFTVSETEDSSIFLNEDKLRNVINETKPAHISYGVRVLGVVPPEIRIGCNCTGDQIAALRFILNDIKFNNRTVDFNINHRSNLNEVNNFDDIDVLLIPEYGDINVNDFNEVLDFLEKDKGVLEISRLDTIDDEHENIFGLEENQTSISNELNNANFENTDEKKKPNFRPWELFTHIPLRLILDEEGSSPGNAGNRTEMCGGDNTYRDTVLRNKTMASMICNQTSDDPSFFLDMNQDDDYNPGEGPFFEGDTFTFESFNLTVKEIEENSTTIRLPSDYKLLNFRNNGEEVIPKLNNDQILLSVGNYSNDDPLPVSIVYDENELSSLRGRSIWLSDMISPDSYEDLYNSDYSHLIKTSLIYATKDEYVPIPAEDVRPGVLGSDLYVTYNGDLFETARVVLTLWFAF